MEQVIQIPRKRGRPSNAAKAAEAAAKAKAIEEAAKAKAAEEAAAAAAAAAAEVVTIPASVSPAKRLCRKGKKARFSEEVLRAEDESDKASTIVAVGEVVPETGIEREERERRMQAYEMEAKVNALVSERIYEIRDEIADELIGSTEIRDAIANELIGCMTALLERTTREIADRYNNEHRPLEHWID